MRKREFTTDRNEGIRTIVQIRNLPVKELTDTEICKLFSERFDANALIMFYEDKSGKRQWLRARDLGLEIAQRGGVLCDMYLPVEEAARAGWGVTI